MGTVPNITRVYDGTYTLPVYYGKKMYILLTSGITNKRDSISQFSCQFSRLVNSHVSTHSFMSKTEQNETELKMWIRQQERR